MYYSLTYQSQQKLFTTAEEAWHRLRAGQVWLQMHDCILIDYLLVPHSMQCIVQGRLRMGASKFLHISPLTNEQLLIVFGELGKLGKEYPFCGTYELYHASKCFAELGKAGYYSLPYPLSVILQAKNKRSGAGLPAVRVDEIA